MAESQTKRLLKHSSLYAIGIVVRRITGLIMLPIYTNYLSPSDYGVVGLLVFAVTLFEIVFGARFVQALPKFYHDYESLEKKNTLVSTALILTSSISFIFVFILFLLQDYGAVVLFGDDQYSVAFGLFTITLLTTAIENYGLTYMRLRDKPGLFVCSGILKLILQLCLNILFVVFIEMGYMGVIWGNLIASIVFAVLLGGYTLFYTGLVLKASLVKDLFIFSWPLWLASLASLYIGSSNRIFLSHLTTLGDVGILILAATFAQLVRAVVWRPVNQYWQIERFKHYKDGEEISPIYNKFFKAVCILLFTSVVILGIYTKSVLLLMSDQAFHEAYKYVSILAVNELFGSLSVFFSFAFIAKSKTIIITRNTYLNAAFITIFNIILITKYQLLGACIALLLSGAFNMYITYKSSVKILDLKVGLKCFFIMLAISSFILIIYPFLTKPDFFHEFINSTILFVIYALLTFMVIIRDEDLKNLILVKAITYIKKR